MLTYGILLVFVLACALVATNNNEGRLPKRFPVALAITALVLVCGLRVGTGTDTWSYVRWYAQLPYTELGAYRDVGFSALCRAIQFVCGEDPAWMFVVVAALTVVPTVLTLRAHGQPFALSVALYMFAGSYFYGFNGARQAMAAAIVFAASKFMFQAQWKPFFAVVLAAALFHSTVLFFIPIYFIVNPRVAPAIRVGLAAILIAAVFNHEAASGLLTPADEVGRFDVYAEGNADNEGGSNVVRVLVRFVIFAFAALRRRELRRLFPDRGSALVSLMALDFLLYVLSLKNWLYARVAYYPGMYEMLVLPAVAQTFPPAVRRTLAVVIFVSFLAYAVALLLAGESDLLPYRSLLG